MNIFYAPHIDCNRLDKEEAYHCHKVLRLKEGDHISLVNGKGLYAEAQIVKCSQKETTYHVVSTIENYNDLGYNLHIAIAPTKNMNRFEWFIEKATEIGITEITPLICENSERRVIKNDRLQKLIISAAKQSKKAMFPVLNEMVKFSEFVSLQNPGPKKNKLIAYCSEEDSPMLNDFEKPVNSLICIGPEGDFSPNEITLATSMGFKGISLGKSRLRTETAAIYTCSVINLLNNKN